MHLYNPPDSSTGSATDVGRPSDAKLTYEVLNTYKPRSWPVGLLSYPLHYSRGSQTV